MTIIMKVLVSVIVLLGLLDLVFSRPIPAMGPNLPDNGRLEMQKGKLDTVTVIGPFADDCKQYCWQTYPEHTYPEVSAQPWP